MVHGKRKGPELRSRLPMTSCSGDSNEDWHAGLEASRVEFKSRLKFPRRPSNSSEGTEATEN